VNLIVHAVADSTTDEADGVFDGSRLEDNVFDESDPDTEDDASSSDYDVLVPPDTILR
jgi:hypothetical protein